MAAVRVGISGWTYPPWRDEFYPVGLPQRLELAYASRRFNSLEINGTFYSLQKPASFEAWHDASPPGFVFSLKGGRYVTHMRRLKDVRAPLANYFASGVLRLRDKLGPFLWQFPPSMPFDEDRFRVFLDLLPHDTGALARLASEHDDFLDGAVALEPDAARPVRHAVEFRHKSFLTDRFVDLVREHNIALVAADVAGKFPTAQDVTADWVYIRLHGSRTLYASGYGPKELDAWSDRIRAWHDGTEPDDAHRIGQASPAVPAGRDVYVYFDNTDVKLRAPVDARSMAERLGIGPDATPKQIVSELGVEPKPKPSKARKKAAKKTRPAAE